MGTAILTSKYLASSTTFTFNSSPQMAVNLPGWTAQAGLDVTQLLNVANGPLEPAQTLDAPRALTLSENYIEVARRLEQEDAAKLVDVFDQVCHRSLQETTLTRLTMAMTTRPSDPSIQRLKEWRCYVHSALSAASRLNSHARRFYPMDWRNVGTSPSPLEVSPTCGVGRTGRKTWCSKFSGLTASKIWRRRRRYARRPW